MAVWYPLMLQLQGKRIAVIGGGQVAERKIRGLLEGGADQIAVIAPRCTEAVRAMAAAGQIELLCREYLVSDLKQARLVFASTDNRQLNLIIAQEAEAAGAWVNVCSEAEYGDFITPTVIRRGPLVLTVTTGGASPALASAIAGTLERHYDDRAGDLAARLAQLREHAKSCITEPQARRAVLRLAAEEVQAQLEHDVKDDRPAERIAEWMERLLQQVIDKEDHR